MKEALQGPNHSFAPEAQGADNALSNLWLKERREGDPEVRFEIVFGPHRNSKDVEIIKDRFKGADIYIPESISWNENIEKMYSGLSHGLIKPEQAESSYPPEEKKGQFYLFGKETRKMIYGSGKEIVFVDVPDDHEMMDKYDILGDKLDTFFKIRDLGEAIKALREYLQFHAEIDKQREELILQQIPLRIREVLDKRKDLRAKPQVKVLLSLGARHTSLYPGLRNLGGEKQVSRTFPSNVMVMGFPEEAIRKIKFGRETVNSMSDEFLAKVALELSFYAYFSRSIQEKSTTEDTLKLGNQIRDIVKSFSTKDIEGVYNLIFKGRKFRDVVLEICRKKGIAVAGF